MIRVFAAAAAVTCVSTLAHAQVTPTPEPGVDPIGIAMFDPDQAVAPVTTVEGRGIKLGEGTVLHPAAGLETGFISNVFYQDQNPIASGVLRVMGQVGIASLNQSRLMPSMDPISYDAADSADSGPDRGDKGSLQYYLDARLAWDEMLSGNPTVRATSGLGAGVTGRVMINPMGNFSVSVDENYLRSIRAANFETSENDNRDVNIARVSLLVHPHDHSVSGYLYYQNTVDVFEQDQNIYPSRLDQRIGAHPMWQWLPQTVVYADVSGGIVTGIGSATPSQQKPTSYPLIARAGVTTLVSTRITLDASVGYTNGFYTRGPSYSAPVADVWAAYRYSPLGRFGLAYELVHSDSVNANFYRDHVIRAFLDQRVSALVFALEPELHFRQYDGVVVPGASTRNDVLFAVVAGVRYEFRDWIAASLDYRFETRQTDYRYIDATSDTVDPSYLRHELMIGVRVSM